ncbi:MAG: outer membrane beta-barrel protein, partial [Bacteroidia bacterium]
FYNLPIRNHEVFGVELLFTQIESKEQIVDTFGTAYKNYPNGAIPLISTNTVSKHISYLSLPVHYGINVKKFTFNVGMQFSVRLLSSAKEVIQDSYTNNASGYGFVLTPSTATYNYKRLIIKDVDFGETVGILYHLTNKFAIEGNYYYGFNNIYPNSRRTTQWKTQQITLGLRYAFLALKKKEIVP